MKARWYIVNVHSNHERKVAQLIEERFKSRAKLEGVLEEVFVPMEKFVSVKENKKIESERRFFPGYILVKLVMNDDAWQAIKSIPRVTGFLGSNGNRPQSVPQREIDEIFRKVEGGAVSVDEFVEFEVGEVVSVVDGPFASFSGNVEEIDEAKRTVRLSVSIFGRVTPVELTFEQVQKVA